MTDKRNLKDLPVSLAKPAQRALERAGIRTLEDLTRFSEAQVGSLHGIGRKALDLLQSTLEHQGLAFAQSGQKSEQEPVTDLAVIFHSLKDLLECYRPPLVAKVESDRRLDLCSIKQVEIEGRKRPEVYFASIIIQKDYVGFYFMPVYSAPEMKALFAPELLHLLKGKSCFHIRKLDRRLLEQVRAALQNGYDLYRERGWV